MTSYKELLAKKAQLDAEINSARDKEREAGIETIKQLMEDLDISISDLSKRRGPKKRGPQPPKYRDPVSGKTWSGRGKPPAWIAGKDRGPFLIPRSED